MQNPSGNSLGSLLLCSHSFASASLLIHTLSPLLRLRPRSTSTSVRGLYPATTTSQQTELAVEASEQSLWIINTEDGSKEDTLPISTELPAL